MWMAFISGEGQLTLLTVFSFALIRGGGGIVLFWWLFWKNSL